MLSNTLRVIVLRKCIFVLKGVGVHEVSAASSFMRFRFSVDRSVTDMRASRAWADPLRETSLSLACANVSLPMAPRPMQMRAPASEMVDRTGGTGQDLLAPETWLRKLPLWLILPPLA